MFLEFMFVCLYLFAVFEGISCANHGETKLFIVTSGGEENPSIVDRNVTDPLQMTCYLVGDNNSIYNLNWKLPGAVQTHGLKHHNISLKGSNLTLNFQHLLEGDSGNYVCRAEGNDNNFIQQLRLNVLSRMSDGCDKKFLCAPHKCIHRRFECDGRVDCENGADESLIKCGPRPCEGKIQCEGRCIPVSWCCFPDEPNCTIKNRPQCCPNKSGYEGHYYIPTNYNMDSLRPAVFLVVGCAIMFVIMVSAVVVALCRVQLRRTVLSSFPLRRDVLSNTRYHRTFTHDVGVRHLGVYMSQDNIPSNLLVTYNINNGVQFLEEVLDPPPYNEVESLPVEDPPPPYSFTDEYNGRIVPLNSIARSSPKPEGLSSPSAPGSSVPNLEVPSSNAQLMHQL